MKMCATVVMSWPWDAGRGIALVGTEAIVLGELLADSGGVNNPYMMNSANKKVYQIFIFNNC